MSTTQYQFLQLAMAKQALKLGSFKLKSGRISPYFFNAGIFSSGQDLYQLGQFYAKTLVHHDAQFDGLFGPAYKGIPLATITATALYQQTQRDLPVTYNRKEAKTHGEGGSLVGATMTGKIMIVDDVITAGTAIREAISIIQAAGATPAGVVVALDRQERGQGQLSAIQEVQKEFDIPVYSIATLADIAQFIENDDELTEYQAKIADYKATYGAIG